jgi:hypothetical protein
MSRTGCSKSHGGDEWYVFEVDVSAPGEDARMSWTRDPARFRGLVMFVLVKLFEARFGSMMMEETRVQKAWLGGSEGD